MHRVGFLIIAEEMMRRSGAKGIEVRCWNDSEYSSFRLERTDEYSVKKIARMIRNDGVDQKRRV